MVEENLSIFSIFFCYDHISVSNWSCVVGFIFIYELSVKTCRGNTTTELGKVGKILNMDDIDCKLTGVHM